MQNDAMGEVMPNNPWKVNYNETNLSPGLSARSWLVVKEKVESAAFIKKKIWEKIIKSNKQKISEKLKSQKKTNHHDSNYSRDFEHNDQTLKNLNQDQEYIILLNQLIQAGRDQKATNSREKRSTDFEIGFDEVHVNTIGPWLFSTQDALILKIAAEPSEIVMEYGHTNKFVLFIKAGESKVSF